MSVPKGEFRSRDEGEFRMNLIYNNLIKGQAKFSNSSELQNSSRINDNPPSESRVWEVKAGKNQRTADKLANKKKST